MWHKMSKGVDVPLLVGMFVYIYLEMGQGRLVWRTPTRAPVECCSYRL